MGRSFKQLSAEDGHGHFSTSKKSKKLLLALFGVLLLTAAIIGTVVGVNSSRPKSTASESTAAHTILKSSCSNTRYPELCFSAIASVPEKVVKISSQKDVIEASLNLTEIAVQHSFFTVEELLVNRSTFLTKREKTALHDCLETIDETLDDIHKAEEDLDIYPSGKSLSQHADDLKTLLSAAMTNVETCLDGFSHDGADKHIRDALQAGQVIYIFILYTETT